MAQAGNANTVKSALRTLDRLGIASIAVYSDADATAQHVMLAGQAVRLGPAPARESYLDIERVIAAALSSGAQAVHPGYGFLSESAELARLNRSGESLSLVLRESALGDRLDRDRVLIRRGQHRH